VWLASSLAGVQLSCCVLKAPSLCVDVTLGANLTQEKLDALTEGGWHPNQRAVISDQGTSPNARTARRIANPPANNPPANNPPPNNPPSNNLAFVRQAAHLRGIRSERMCGSTCMPEVREVSRPRTNPSAVSQQHGAYHACAILCRDCRKLTWKCACGVSVRGVAADGADPFIRRQSLPGGC